MSALPDVKKLVRQTQRYEFSDGLRDLQWAIMMVAFGLMTWFVFDHAKTWLVWAVDLAAQFGVVGRWVPLLITLIPGLLVLVALLLMRMIRRRWLWRGSGYVKPRRWVVPRHVTLISFGIITVAIAVGILAQRTMPADELFLLRMILVASGWSFGYTLVEMGRRLNIPRYIYVGTFGSIATTPLLFLSLTVGQTGLGCGLLWGAALALSSIQPLHQAARAAGETRHE